MIAQQVVENGAGVGVRFGRSRPCDIADVVHEALTRPCDREAAHSIRAALVAAAGAAVATAQEALAC
jgi:UDP:flavonoid glycosyltransferase YjiC (YdhE family)